MFVAKSANPITACAIMRAKVKRCVNVVNPQQPIVWGTRQTGHPSGSAVPLRGITPLSPQINTRHHMLAADPKKSADKFLCRRFFSLLQQPYQKNDLDSILQLIQDGWIFQGRDILGNLFAFG